MSPFTDNSNGLRGFGSEIKSPFQPSDSLNSFGYQPKNPFQKSRLFDDGSSTSQTMGGSSFSGHASTSPFSLGKLSTLFGCSGNQQSHDNPFQQHSSPSGGEVLAWRESPTVGRSSNIFGKASIPTGKASPFMFNTKEQEVKIPFQQSKAFGGGGLASKISQTTIDPSIIGRASTSPFSFGKPSPSNGNKSKNPFKQSTFLAGASLASKPSQEMGGSGSFSSGKPSTFANSSNVHKPEPTNLFQHSPQESNRSPWSQQGMGISTKSGGSPSFMAVPFRQLACCQNPFSPFTSGTAEMLLNWMRCVHDQRRILAILTKFNEDVSGHPEGLACTLDPLKTSMKESTAT